MSRRTQKNVGVIGLGIIGSRVAENLRRCGFYVFVWNRTPRPFPNFVGSRSEVTELCELIQIFVSDDDALLETIAEIKGSLNAHHVVMVHSTVAPHTMRAAAEIVQRRGAQFLDAPFTGSKIAAEKGELVYYVGGDPAAFQRVRPVLEASSKEILELGEIGHATIIKVATNMITATTVQAAAEALALVHRAGLTPEKLSDAMRGNGSQSATLAMKLPNMISGHFETHFSTKHMLKDVHIASRLGRSLGLNLGATEAARDSLRSEAEAGRGDADYSSVVRNFFPDGIPGTAETQTQNEGQQTLAGLEGGSSDSAMQQADRLAAAPQTDADEPAIAPSESSTEQAVTEEGPAEPKRHEEIQGDVELTTTQVAEATTHSDETEPTSSAADTSVESSEHGSARRVDREAVTVGNTRPAPPEKEAPESRRGLLSRIFGRGVED